MSKISVRVSPRLLVRDILVSGVFLSAGLAVAPASAGELVSGQNIGMAGGAVAGGVPGGVAGNRIDRKAVTGGIPGRKGGSLIYGQAVSAVGGGVLGGVVGGALSR